MASDKCIIGKLIIILLLIFVARNHSYASSVSEDIDVSVGKTVTLRLPYSVTNRDLYSVKWFNKAPGYLEISNESNYSCTIKGLKSSGNSRYYVECDYYYTYNSKSYKGTYSFAVKIIGNNDGGGQNDTGDFYLTEHDVTIKVGEGHQLKTVFTSSPATVTWDWSRSGIVTLNQTGYILGVTPGVVQIYAKTSMGRYDTCNVTVVAKNEEPDPSLKDGDLLIGNTPEGHILYFTVLSSIEKTIRTGFSIGDTYYQAKEFKSANSITIPEYVKGYKVAKIGYLSFCSDHMKTNFDMFLPSSVVEIESCAFLQNSKLRSINFIPEEMDIIPSQCFDKCTSFNEINIPASIKKLDYRCLAETAIKEFKTPANSQLSEIIMQAFSDCKNLEIVDLGTNISFIHCAAFYNCSKIKELIIRSSEYPYIYGGESSIFYWSPSLYDSVILHVPEESIDKYKKSSEWGLFKNIIPIESSSINDIIYDEKKTSTIYYNLEGKKVENPEHGIFIKVTNGVASKIVIP